MHWDELSGQLARRGYELDEQGVLVASVGRTGWVRVGKKALAGILVAQVVVQVCPEAWLDPRQALRMGASIPTGALVIIGDQYVLHQVLPLASTRLEDLDVVIQHLCNASRRLRTRLLTPSHHRTFDVYSA